LKFIPWKLGTFLTYRWCIFNL